MDSPNVLLRLGQILGMLARLTPQEIEAAAEQVSLAPLYREHILGLLALRRRLDPIREEASGEPR